VKLRLAALTFAGVLSVASAPLGASAAPNGLAWDSVTKMVMNADASSLQPGDFDADYAAAASVQMPEQNGGGIFAQMHQAMAAGQGVQQMMQNGMAEKHYVAGSKERTDNVAQQTATITDCAARTITTLDLRRKTYKVVSMDQTSAPSGGSGRPSSSSGDNGTRVAITLTNTALGARQVGGQPTNGYRAEMTMTMTDSSGESTQSAALLGYYSSIARPTATCFSGVPMTGGRGAGMMGGYAQIMQALSGSGINPRFSVKQSGPPLPLDRLSMYDAMTFGAQGHGGGATFVTERGNVRQISADDPIFGVPPDFTQAR
jgi:hypothetical protein